MNNKKKNTVALTTTRTTVKTTTPKSNQNKNTNAKAMKRISAPVAVTYTSRNVSYISQPRRMDADTVRFSGRDYLGTYSIPANAQAGTTIANLVINPSSGPFRSTKLAVYSQLYDKYVFQRMKFVAVSSAGTSTNGTYGLAYDADMADTTPPTGDDGIRQFYGMRDTCYGPCWESQIIDVRKRDNQDFYFTNYTGYDGRLCAQGQMYLFCIRSDTASSVPISIFIEYDVDFQDPQLETTVPTNSVKYTAGLLGPAVGESVVPVVTQLLPNSPGVTWSKDTTPLNQWAKDKTSNASQGFYGSGNSFMAELSPGQYVLDIAYDFINGASAVGTAGTLIGLFPNLATFNSSTSITQNNYNGDNVNAPAVPSLVPYIGGLGQYFAQVFSMAVSEAKGSVMSYLLTVPPAGAKLAMAIGVIVETAVLNSIKYRGLQLRKIN